MNLAEGLQSELNRVREMKRRYEEIPGGAGMIAATFMRLDIEKAEKAIMSGDVIEMLRVYESLKGFTD